MSLSEEKRFVNYAMNWNFSFYVHKSDPIYFYREAIGNFPHRRPQSISTVHFLGETNNILQRDCQ